MRTRFAVWFVAVAIVITVMALAQTPGAAQSALARQAVPRTPDGKPDFTGVWAGPGFSHKVGPNDTDTPQVTPYDPKKMSPFKPGGEPLMNHPLTGDVLQDDPVHGLFADHIADCSARNRSSASRTSSYLRARIAAA